jgi:nuclear pore complex protein Nup107
MFFRAKESFSDWFDHFHREKPKPPTLPPNPTFTEKVAFEQKTKQYQRDLER